MSMWFQYIHIYICNINRNMIQKVGPAMIEYYWKYSSRRDHILIYVDTTTYGTTFSCLYIYEMWFHVLMLGKDIVIRKSLIEASK